MPCRLEHGEPGRARPSKVRPAHSSSDRTPSRRCGCIRILPEPICATRPVPRPAVQRPTLPAAADLHPVRERTLCGRRKGGLDHYSSKPNPSLGSFVSWNLLETFLSVPSASGGETSRSSWGASKVPSTNVVMDGMISVRISSPCFFGFKGECNHE